MTLELRDDTAVVSGILTVDEVEPLAGWLRMRPDARVDLRGCTHLHTAGLQALLRFRPVVTGPPADPFLAGHILPYLVTDGTAAPPPDGTAAPPPDGTAAPPPDGTAAPPPDGTADPPAASEPPVAEPPGAHP